MQYFTSSDEHWTDEYVSAQMDSFAQIDAWLVSGEDPTLLKYNVMNSSCDWCLCDRGSKPVRYICDSYDVPLLAICKDCETTHTA